MPNEGLCSLSEASAKAPVGMGAHANGKNVGVCGRETKKWREDVFSSAAFVFC
jgi:hypothetical protein